MNYIGKLHENDDGSFQELWRTSQLDIKQISMLKINKGAVRGNHYHFRKGEWFMCIDGRVVVKFEDREGTCWEVELDDKKLELLKIPLETMHSVESCCGGVASVLIFCDEEYDEKDADTFKEW